MSLVKGTSMQTSLPNGSRNCWNSGRCGGAVMNFEQSTRCRLNAKVGRRCCIALCCASVICFALLPNTGIGTRRIGYTDNFIYHACPYSLCWMPRCVEITCPPTQMAREAVKTSTGSSWPSSKLLASSEWQRQSLSLLQAMQRT